MPLLHYGRAQGAVSRCYPAVFRFESLPASQPLHWSSPYCASAPTAQPVRAARLGACRDQTRSTALPALRPAPGPAHPGSRRCGTWPSSCRSPQQFTKTLRRRISQNLLDRPVRNVAVGLLASTRRPSHQHPVGRTVTGSTEPLRIDERLQEVNGMPVHLLPVIGNPSRHPTQDMRRQIFSADPGQDQEARVVSDEPDAVASCSSVPTDVAVAAAEVTGSRCPGQARDGTAFSPYQKLQALSNRLLVTKIVMLLHQAVEQRLLRAATHLLEFERLKFVQRIFDGTLIDQHRLRPGSVCQRIMPHVTNGRQRDLTGPLQHQQHAAAYHVAQRAIGLPPLPGFTYSDRQLAAAFLRILLDQRTYIEDVFLKDLPPAISELCHCPALWNTPFWNAREKYVRVTILTSVRSRAATSAQHRPATRPQPPSATALRKPQPSSPPFQIQATT